MTKNLKWRLSKLPTVDELTSLVSSKIITQEEAREILLTSETQEDRDKKSLETEIKFLRELVEKLSNRSQIVEVIREIKPSYKTYPWYPPYITWCSNLDINPVNNMFAASTVTGDTTAGSHSASSFSNIKTF